MAYSSETLKKQPAKPKNPSGKRLPPCLIELLDISIFSFVLQSGRRASNSVRGDPVVEGASAMFGDMLLCAKEETRAAFDAITPERLGNWKPGTQPTDEVRQLLKSRLLHQKKNGMIRDRGSALVPDALIEKDEELDEITDRVITKKTYYLCWRCKNKCRHCMQSFPFVKTFRTE